MATKEDIITLPADSLRQSSDTVTFPLSTETRNTIADMKQAALDWESSRQHEFGVALAAVQINRLKRIIVVRTNFNNKSDTEFNVYINPEITRHEGELIEDFEGCLSVIDTYGRVKRYAKVKVKAKDEHGKTVKFLAKGFLARVFQHEIDHTNGLTFVDRIGQSGEFFELQADGSMRQLNLSQLAEFIRVNKVPAHGSSD